MQTLDDKVSAALALIGRCTATYRRPVVLSSFGKDSMVLLSLVEQIAGKLPVIFWREPFNQKKYAFANEVIASRGYAVYDYPPSSTSVLKMAGYVEIMNAYQVGRDKFLDLPTGIAPPVDGRSYLCGYEDLYNKPVGGFVFPWDLMFHGHKSSDVDLLRGPVPLRLDVFAPDGAPAAAFPLRYFTDEDVWRYTEKHSLPVHTTRYDQENDYHERPDTTLNPDYHYACVACMDPDTGPVVRCPRLGAEINNRWPQLRKSSGGLPVYVGKDG